MGPASISTTSILTYNAVKFDTAKLPAILNALETTNNNQKLVLEVSVRTLTDTEKNTAAKFRI